jgi:hypothetical protein
MATLKLKADISELQNIEQELKRLSELMKPLRARKKEIETNILKFMETTNKQQQQTISAIKMSNVELVAVEKKTREKLHKEEKEQHAIQLLKSNGIQNASKVYNDLQELMKGKEQTQNKLKIKDSNSNTSSTSSSSTSFSSSSIVGGGDSFKMPKSSSTTKATKASLQAFENLPVPNFVHPSNVYRSNQQFK